MKEEEKSQPPVEPVEKESFLTRMQRKGVMAIKPPAPGELDVLEQIRQMKEGQK